MQRGENIKVYSFKDLPPGPIPTSGDFAVKQADMDGLLSKFLADGRVPSVTKSDWLNISSIQWDKLRIKAVPDNWKQLDDFATQLTLPHERFNRLQGIFSGMAFDPQGGFMTEEAFAQKRHEMLPTEEDYEMAFGVGH